MDSTYGVNKGDIFVGKLTGNTYKVVSIVDHTQVRTEIISLGKEAQSAHFVGRVSTNRISGLDFIRQSDQLTNTNTNTKENTNMDNSSINQAINNLAAEEATDTVRPTYQRFSALVRSVKIGEAIMVHRKATDDMQFYCRLAEGRWVYGNGASIKSTEETIAHIVRWVTEDPTTKVRRLVKEAKG